MRYVREGRRQQDGWLIGFGYATPIPVMAKWFPDKRGLAVGLAAGGYGAGSAIFLVMTIAGALLLRNPPAGYRPEG
jgi:OFA family oxalate/formate antiporter-like MFS transporter